MERRPKIAPEEKPTGRLSRIAPTEVLNPDAPDLNDPALMAELQSEIEMAWESDWSIL